MKRRAFKMTLKKGFAAEYKKRHDHLWPSLAKAFNKAGIVEYSIFLDEDTSSLIAFQQLADDNTVATLCESELMKNWWEHMADIMEAPQGSTPTTRPLREVFHLD